MSPIVVINIGIIVMLTIFATLEAMVFSHYFYKNGLNTFLSYMPVIGPLYFWGILIISTISYYSGHKVLPVVVTGLLVIHLLLLVKVCGDPEDNRLCTLLPISIAAFHLVAILEAMVNIFSEMEKL